MWKYFSFENSPPVLTGDIMEFFSPAGDATISEILDHNGDDVTSTYVDTSGAVKAGTKIKPDKYFSSITGSAGAINWKDGKQDRDYSKRA